MNQKNILKNIIAKQGTATEFDPITDAEIDEMFGTAAGTGTNAQDYVIEHYQNGGTEGYTKWASGKCEVWKRIRKKLSSTIQWTSMYYGKYSDNSITYTMTGFTGFVGYPMVQLTLQCVSGNIMALVGDYSTYSSTGIGTYYVYSADSRQNVDSTINVYAVGRWKE